MPLIHCADAGARSGLREVPRQARRRGHSRPRRVGYVLSLARVDSLSAQWRMAIYSCQTSGLVESVHPRWCCQTSLRTGRWCSQETEHLLRRARRPRTFLQLLELRLLAAKCVDDYEDCQNELEDQLCEQAEDEKVDEEFYEDASRKRTLCGFAKNSGSSAALVDVEIEHQRGAHGDITESCV